MFDAFDTIAIVPARDGSKGFPGKNFKKFNKKPLFLHAIEQALRTCDCCIFSSDNANALAKAESIKNVYSHKRDAKLAGDNSSIIDTLLNIIEHFNLKNKYLVILQPTSPLRLDSTINKAINTFHERNFDLVMGVTESDSSILKYGFVSNGEFKPINDPKYCFSNRQELPSIFRPNGSCFVFSSSWLILNGSLATENIGCIQMSEDESVDIDTQEDFIKAEQIFCRRGLKTVN
jgi:CMP-N,N'-diacetyllegionaminic acid synthase